LALFLVDSHARPPTTIMMIAIKIRSRDFILIR
jgi:hypothetical protein